MPQMILPLLLVGSWATFITCISHFYHYVISQEHGAETDPYPMG
jgi:hypothetical protein